MAKSGSTRLGRTSRIRFVMLDAELADGDLTQVVHAIQNALRTNPVTQPRLVTPPASPALSGGVEAGNIEGFQAVIGDQENSESGEKAVERKVERTERVSKPRKYTSPEVIEVDLKMQPSFSDFIADKKIDSDADRFLTIAAWFKECRQVNEITASHVYTCYRAAHWPCSIKQFDQPLRNLKFRKLMTSPSRGQFAINHLGLDHVAALSNG